MTRATRHSHQTSGNSASGDEAGNASASGAGADRDVKLRRAHRKSRNGCKECKRRHVKCDETRPSCVNCVTAERRCSYLDSLSASSSAPARSIVMDGSGNHAAADMADVPDTTMTGMGEVSGGGGGGGGDGRGGGGGVAAASASSNSSVSTPSITAVVNDFVMRNGEPNQVASPANGQFFTLEHLNLFRHLQTGMPFFASVDFNVCIKAALSAPYLMDIMLATAALHMAHVVDPSRVDYYRHQATQLQTRGLVLFNQAKEEVSEATCMPMFFFSAIVGSQLLCECLRDYRHDFNAFLDQFAWYLTIHRGVDAIAIRSWDVIRRGELKDLIDFFEANEPRNKGPEVDDLQRMLDVADLGPSSLRACRETAEVLRESYGIYRTTPPGGKPSHKSAAVISFGVHVTAGFIDLVRQRRPEALVILAYYAVMLHWCRDYWVIADAGQFMIRAISTHLGDYWSEWLAFPHQVLEDHEREERMQQQQQQQHEHAG